MPDELLIDTDVLMKLVGYQLGTLACTLATKADMAPAMLGAARYMLASHVRRSRRISKAAAAAAELSEMLSMIVELEPSHAEIALAAEIEAAAAAASLAIDGGESQLIAMLVLRGGSLLLTGDKRAVAALPKLQLALPQHRIMCLEQLLMSLADAIGPTHFRGIVCAEPAVDTAVTLACSCSSAIEVDPREGLVSYINHLRAAAADLLRPGAGMV